MGGARNCILKFRKDLFTVVLDGFGDSHRRIMQNDGGWNLMKFRELLSKAFLLSFSFCARLRTTRVSREQHPCARFFPQLLSSFYVDGWRHLKRIKAALLDKYLMKFTPTCMLISIHFPSAKKKWEEKLSAIVFSPPLWLAQQKHRLSESWRVTFREIILLVLMEIGFLLLRKTKNFAAKFFAIRCDDKEIVY